MMGDNSISSVTSESDGESDKNSLSSYLPPYTGTKSSHKSSATGAEAKRLTGSLKETTDTLQDVDRMLGEYQSIARTQASSINKLKDKISDSKRSRRSSVSSLRSSDLEYSTGRERGRRTYRPTSPLRDYQYASDQEYRRSSRRRPRSAVRFRDEVRVGAEHLHDIHRSVRDLSADHERLESDLEREIRNRYRHEREHDRSLHDLTSSLRPPAVPRQSSIENVERRLERKLENIATKIESRQKSDTELGAAGGTLTAASLSKSLTEALRASQTNLSAPVPSHPAVDLSQHRISDLETDKRRLQNEIDIIKQKHDQGEGARRALSLQVEELRSKLREVDDERHRALRLAEEFKDSEKKSRKKQRDITRVSEDENQRLQMEVQDLRTQLSHTISREEVEVMRRELQKNEKQRLQLTEHIETLTKDIRHKEQHTTTLLSEVTELTTTKSRLETDSSRLQTELDQAKQSIRENSQRTQKVTEELGVSQADLVASEKRKEDMKSKATEVVKLWKAKCKALQKESEDYREMSVEQGSRCDQLVNESETLRSQLLAVSNQMDRLTQEMAELMTAKQDLEDKTRRQESEFKDLRRVKSDVEHANHEQQLKLQQCEREARKMNDQFINYEAESAQLTDKLTATKDQLETLEQQHRLLKSDQADLQAELGRRSQLLKDRDSSVQDLETKLLTLEASESAVRRELEILHSQLARQQESHEKTASELLTKTERLKKELTEVKTREIKTGEEYHRKFKHLQADKDAEVESMRVDLEEAHISVQNVKKQAKKQNDEYLRLEQKYRQAEDEFTTYKIQTKRLKENSDDLREQGEQHEQRCKEMEADLSRTKQTLNRLEQQHNVLTQAVHTELQVLVETAEASTEHKYSDKHGDASSPPDTLSDLASKTTWIRRYIRTSQDTERQLRADMKMRLEQEKSEKGELIAEIKRQQGTMDEMSSKHRELVDDVIAREDEVVKLEDKLTELSFHVEEQKALDDAVEKSKILEKYQRLQSAVSSLKQELRSSASSDSLESRDSKNSARQRQVRISEIVVSNDGTRAALKENSPPHQSSTGYSSREPHEHTGVDDSSVLKERIDAYNKALGPNSYRTALDEDNIEEVQGTYINDVSGRAPDLSYDGNYRNSGSLSGSYRPKATVETRRHSTPRKTLASKS